MDTTFTHHLRDSIARNLAAFARDEIGDPTLRQAAVCIAVSPGPTDDRACFLLTRRASTMARHTGQYALPGGRVDDDESSEEGALRELEEELGIPAADVQIIGHLDDYATRSGFCITPVVTWIDGPVEIRADPGEVEACFHIPLDDLLSPDLPRLQNIAQSERPVLSIVLATLAHEVFAPTAAMLYQFREVALRGRHTRVAGYEQPVFAWR